MNEELHLIFDIAKESMSNAITHLEKKLMNRVHSTHGVSMHICIMYHNKT